MKKKQLKQQIEALERDLIDLRMVIRRTLTHEADLEGCAAVLGLPLDEVKRIFKE